MPTSMLFRLWETWLWDLMANSARKLAYSCCPRSATRWQQLYAKLSKFAYSCIQRVATRCMQLYANLILKLKYSPAGIRTPTVGISNRRPNHAPMTARQPPKTAPMAWYTANPYEIISSDLTDDSPIRLKKIVRLQNEKMLMDMISNFVKFLKIST